MKKRKNNYQLLYFDPESSHNLYVYAHSLLSNMTLPALYVCSSFYDYLPLPGHVCQKPIISYFRFQNKVLQGLSLLCSYLIIAYYLVRYRPSVVHIQWLKLPEYEVWFYRQMRRLLGFKLVFTAHNIMHRYKEEYYRGLYKKWYEYVDAIIVHTQDTRSDLVSKFGINADKVHIIMHGILDSTPHTPISAARMQELEARYPLEGKMVFSSLGAQSYYKGVDILLSVWQNTPELRENNDLRLVVVGPKKDVDVSPLCEFENVFAESRRIPDDEFDYLLRHTDVYLLPYRDISQSGALLTAIAAQVPVLAAAVGGLKDPFTVAPIGWTIPEASEALLREAILHLVHHPELVEDVKRNKHHWELVREHYGWERIGNQTQQLYVSLLS